MSKPPSPSNRGPTYRSLGKPAMRCGPAGWLALLLIKLGDVETNPGPTTRHKQVWISDICYKQIHGMKQIPIRSNRIEHWVHLSTIYRYLTCHLHRESGLTTHTDIAPPHPSSYWSKPLPIPYLHHPHQRNTRPTLPCSHRIGKSQTQSSHPLNPLSSHEAPSQTHTHLT